MRTAFDHILGGWLYRETLSALCPAAVDRFSAACRVHSLPESLRSFLFEVAFLCCCFRHRSCSFSLRIGGYYKRKLEYVKQKPCDIYKQNFHTSVDVTKKAQSFYE
jgi:hypothetical protein